MLVRPEIASDIPVIAEVVSLAFDGRVEEAEMVRLIRESPGFEVSLVAEVDGTVAGHVMFSWVGLDGDATRILALAPLAVSPEHQGHGIGAALVREGIERCRKTRAEAVIVEGHPAYYPRFGFTRASDHGILRPSENIPDDAFMVILLGDERPTGQITYPSPFHAAGPLGPG